MLFATIARPQVGLLAWIWLTVMLPHRSTFGWLYNFPVNDLVAFLAITSCIAHWKTRKILEPSPIVTLLAIFYVWVTLTTIFAVDFAISFGDWLEFSKAFLLVRLLLLFMNNRHWIIAAISVFIISAGFYGVKGGLFTIITGGDYRVWGPDRSSWGDNNAVCLVMLICIPLCVALRHVVDKRIYKYAVVFAAILMFATVLGTQSRGGLVGLLGMSLVMILRSRRRFAVILVIAVALPAGVLFMPDHWRQRMLSIQNYDEDGSASARIIQWYYAINIANERPLFGNGFDAFFYGPYYNRYVADKDENRAVHSNYFQILGEHGYIGLLLYLSIMGTAFFSAGKWGRVLSKNTETKWASSLLDAAQFSIVGYAFNGLTVNMAYLDLYYILLSFIIILISYGQTAPALGKVSAPGLVGRRSFERNTNTISSHGPAPLGRRS